MPELPTGVVVLGVTSSPEIDAAAELLATTPTAGAVVLGEADTVVTYAHLVRGTQEDLPALWRKIARKFYTVLDASGQPWIPPYEVAAKPSPAREIARRAKRLVRLPLHQRLAMRRQRWWRTRFLWKLRWEAWLAGTDLELRVAEDLYVEPGVRFQLAPVKALLEIGPRCRMYNGVLLRLRGELVVGPGVEIRHDVSLNVKGRLEIDGRNVLGKGVMVHADSVVQIGWGVCLGEYATVLDSHHELDGSLVQMLDQGVDAFPIRLEAASFVGAKASIMPGVTVGQAAVVGAGSVATKDVPAGCIVGGVPARVLRTAAER